MKDVRTERRTDLFGFYDYLSQKIKKIFLSWEFFFFNFTAEQIFRNVWWRVNGWHKAVLSPRGLRWGDEQKQLQMLMPIRNEANVWGTKGRKTQTLCCVPGPATAPIRAVFRTRAAKCECGSAESVYLGQLMCTVCIQAFSQRKDTWSLLACLEGCGTCHKSCFLCLRRINSGSRSAAVFPPQPALAYAQNHHPCLALRTGLWPPAGLLSDFATNYSTSASLKGWRLTMSDS